MPVHPIVILKKKRSMYDKPSVAERLENLE